MDREQVVHILQEGFVLCRFSTQVPRDWPEGNVWVGIIDAQSATCQECLQHLPEESKA
jgi:hypothetical protein